MRLPAAVFCAVAILLLLVPAQADDPAADVLFVLTANPIAAPAQPSSPSAQTNERSDLKLLATGLIRVYQLFVSSQSTDVCIFTPSCSRFSTAAINRYGVVHGGLMAFDRLTRCSGLGVPYYSIDPATGKCIDPVENEYLYAR